VRRALPILLGLTILAAACGENSGGERGAVSTSPATVDADLLSQFDYEASAPLDVQEVKSEMKDGAVVHDITYAGPEGRIDAFLITPQGDGPYPAVEFMPGAPGAKYTFYTEAIELAATSDPKRLEMYDTGHELNAQAKADARAWLLDQLGASA
jgi:hypothetical protein